MDEKREAMPKSEAEPVYYDLTIVAASSGTDIWLGDDAGHLVQKAVGTPETSVLPGHYVVEFGLGTAPYPIHLARSSRHTQQELAAGPTCSRPVPGLFPK